MAKFDHKPLVGFAGVVVLACVVFCNPPFADDVSGIETEVSLTAKVAALEKKVAQLQQQIQNDKMVSLLDGHYWVEASRVVAGEKEEQSDEVAWRLSTDVSSNRYILGPEVSSYEYGPFSIDASKEPAWIDFEVQRSGKSQTVKGLVRTSYGRCEIAIPGKLFDGYTFLNPARPTSFESTADNGYDVYKLVRERYQKTRVWQ
ncbi:MAG: hypothetical protein FD138_2046 [Planctomycetota bacterium]|nr:MAG: hypothetical protein FD138_2046 [Planctomycetota bacterium]